MKPINEFFAQLEAAGGKPVTKAERAECRRAFLESMGKASPRAIKIATSMAHEAGFAIASTSGGEGE